MLLMTEELSSKLFTKLIAKLRTEKGGRERWWLSLSQRERKTEREKEIERAERAEERGGERV